MSLCTAYKFLCKSKEGLALKYTPKKSTHITRPYASLGLMVSTLVSVSVQAFSWKHLVISFLISSSTPYLRGKKMAFHICPIRSEWHPAIIAIDRPDTIKATEVNNMAGSALAQTI